MSATPLLPVALAFVGGLLLGEFYHPPLVILFSSAFFAILAAAVLGPFRHWLLWPAVVLTGWVIHNTQIAVLSPCDLRNLQCVQSGKPRLVSVRGLLVRTPELRGGDEARNTSVRAYVKVSALQPRHGVWMQASGTILATGRATLSTDFFAGRQVEITGVMESPRAALAPGLFDYRAYLRRHGIHFLLRTSSPADWTLRESPTISRPWTDCFQHWALGVLAYGLPHRDESLDLLRSMTLGSMEGITPEDFEPFQRSGTLHIFAISGLHIVLISAILLQVLRALRLPRNRAAAITLPIIWFYTAATGWQPSAIRATLMMSVIIGGWVLARPGNMLNSVAAAGLLILAFDPQQLFGASFQLSFVVVLSLVLLMPVFKQRIDSWLAFDPLLPSELTTPTQRHTRLCARYVLLALGVSLASWLGALPLTAYYFNLFGPVTLLANIIIVPLSNFALAGNMAALLVNYWLPFFTDAFNHSSWALMHFIIWLSRKFTSIPGGHWFIPTPTRFDCCLFYAVLIGIITGIFRNQRYRPYAWTAMAIGGVIVFAEVILRPATQITMLPVASGAAVFVSGQTHPKRLLIDTGPTNSAQFLVRPFLRAAGCNSLDGLVLTHGDLQHFGGAALLNDNYRVKELFASPIRFRSAAYRRLLEASEVQPKLRHLSRPDHLGSWHILHPGPDDRPRQADDSPLVLWGTFAPGAPTVLLLPDLSEQGQRELLNSYPHFQADIVIASMPGTGEPLVPELLHVLRPRLICLIDPDYPHYERPSQLLLDRLAASGATVIRTSQQGAATLRLNHQTWTVQTMTGFRLSIGPLPTSR